MATYRPSFVDVSGLTQGISQGLEMAAQLKRQEDLLAEQRVDNYLKSYRPDKLRDNDIGVFTGAYNDYKQAALQFSKLNRSGAKPEQLATAKSNMDSALGNLNSIYTNSAMAANKQAEYADYFKTARLKGYDVPEEVTGYINSLSSTPISQMDVQKIPSAYSIDLVPKEIDYDGISKTLNMVGANLKDIQTERSKVPFGKDVNGNLLYADAVTKYAGRDPMTTVDALSRIAKTNSRIRNSAVEELNMLKQGVNSGQESAVSRLAEIQQYFPNVKSVDDVNEYMVFGVPFYRRQTQGTTIDKSSAEQEYRRAKDIQEIAISKQRLAEQGAKGGRPAASHPSVIINSIMESNTSPNTGKGVDVSRDMGAFSLKTLYGSMPINDIKYFSGDPSQGIQPYFRLNVGGEEMVKSPEALNSLIVQSAPDITFKGGVDVYKNIPNVKQQAKPTIPKSGSYIINGKKYTMGSLKKLGYNEQQIQNAIDLGRIKIQ